MKKIFSLLLLACTASSASAQTYVPHKKRAPQQLTVAATAAGEGFSSKRLQRIDRWIGDFIAAEKVPNLVLFVSRNGKIVYHKAFGYSNWEKKTPAATNDIFRIASQTKAIASVALMSLYEEGKFLLDEPVHKYIPAFADPQVLVSYDTLNPAGGTYRTRPAKSAITIRQLLSHASGITYDHPLDKRPEFRIPYLNSLDRDTLATVVNKLAKRPLLADPGSGFMYGLNTEVVGRLIEVFSGQPLDVAIEERVTGPLGMKDTYFYLPQDKAHRLVELYSKGKGSDGITVHPSDTFRLYPVAGAQTYFTAGAGMVSTSLDYGKFCQMLLNGGTFNNRRILSPATIALMLQNQIGSAEVWDRKDKFGLGFQLITEGSAYGGLASPGAYTWGGAYCSEYTIDPEEGLVIQFFTNITPYAHYSELTQKLRNLVYAALE